MFYHKNIKEYFRTVLTKLNRKNQTQTINKSETA
jgi:DNA-binding NarL/FixJ family response regulator